MHPSRAAYPVRVVAALSLILLAPSALGGCGSRARLGASGADQPSRIRPGAYSAFKAVTNSKKLGSLIKSENYLYLPPGIYRLDNPIVISRNTPLFIHGANRSATQLVARNPEKPLFVIEKANLISFANVNLHPTREFTSPTSRVDSRAILMNNTENVTLELLEVMLRDSVLEVNGPGEVRMQGVAVKPHGYTTAPIVIDHPEADVLIVGGNISNGSPSYRLTSAERYHVWTKRGRMRIYGTGVQAALGLSDFRIDAASPLGPHVIADVRSEGTNGLATGHVSTLLTVPRTKEPVDVLMKLNSGAWPASETSRFADYNGTGTLWMIGNHSSGRAKALVVGDAPKATVVGIGNLLQTKDPIQMIGAKEIAVHNLYRDPTDKIVKFASPRASFANRPPIPTIPNIPIPDPILRPIVDVPMHGMLDVTAYGAIPNNGLDDLAAIQAAFDVPRDGRHVYFPAGTYHVSDSIKYNHSESKTTQAIGGWIAGPGSEITKIVRIGGGPVFATEGMAYNTVQGLTFQTKSWNPKTPTTDINFAIENLPGGGHASQEIVFHDVVFDGGQTALGIGLNSATQCSENLMVDVEFRNAQYGLGIGSFNALANIVYNGSWIGNEITVGHERSGHGGTWAILGGTATGTKDRALRIIGSASGVWYHEDFKSDAPTIADRSWTTAGYLVWFERSKLGVGAGSPVSYNFSGTAGPIFLRSEFEKPGIDLTLGNSQNGSFALDLYSRIPGWNRARVARAGQLDKLD